MLMNGQREREYLINKARDRAKEHPNRSDKINTAAVTGRFK
jgi:hypothetical protein